MIFSFEKEEDKIDMSNAGQMFLIYQERLLAVILLCIITLLCEVYL